MTQNTKSHRLAIVKNLLLLGIVTTLIYTLVDIYTPQFASTVYVEVATEDRDNTMVVAPTASIMTSYQPLEEDTTSGTLNLDVVGDSFSYDYEWSAWTYKELKLGTYSKYPKSKVYIQYDISALNTEGVTSTDITSATLNLWKDSRDTVYDLNIIVYPVTQSWDADRRISYLSPPTLGDAQPKQEIVPQIGWDKIDITDLLKDHLDGTLDNYGIAIELEIPSVPAARYCPIEGVEAYTPSCTDDKDPFVEVAYNVPEEEVAEPDPPPPMLPEYNLPVTDDTTLRAHEWYEAMYSKGYLYLGDDNVTGFVETRPLIKYSLNDLVTAQVTGAHIASAKLKLWKWRAINTSPHEINISAVDSKWWNDANNDDAVLWANMPSKAGTTYTHDANTEVGWEQIDVTDLISKQLDGEVPDFGVVLELANTDLSGGWYCSADGYTEISSSGECSEVYVPYLHVYLLNPPTSPTLSVTSQDSSSVTVSWDTIDDANSYKLSHVEGSDFTGATVVDTELSTFSLSDLDPGTYSFRVNAVNAAGLSDWSNTVSVTFDEPVVAQEITVPDPVQPATTIEEVEVITPEPEPEVEPVVEEVVETSPPVILGVTDTADFTPMQQLVSPNPTEYTMPNWYGWFLALIALLLASLLGFKMFSELSGDADKGIDWKGLFARFKEYVINIQVSMRLKKSMLTPKVDPIPSPNKETKPQSGSGETVHPTFITHSSVMRDNVYTDVSPMVKRSVVSTTSQSSSMMNKVYGR